MGTEEIKFTPDVEYGDAMVLFAMLISADEDKPIKLDELMRERELSVYAGTYH